jgi:hypothetical protein
MGKKTGAQKEKRKPGPQGKFQGLRLEYLTSRWSAYETAVIDSKTREFWSDAYAGYWERVEWRKPLNEETDADLFRNASVPEETSISEEDEKLKVETIARVNKVCDSPSVDFQCLMA